MEQFHAHLKQVINIIEIILNYGGVIAPIQTKNLTLIMQLERITVSRDEIFEVSCRMYMIQSENQRRNKMICMCYCKLNCLRL
jgi:hypothetical protein